MKRIMMLFCMLSMLMFLVMPVYATYADNDVDVDFPVGSSGGFSNITHSLQKIWTTVIVVVQVLSVGLIAFAGLRYMFASADQKADIKRRFGMVSHRRSYCFFRIYNNQLCCKGRK